MVFHRFIYLSDGFGREVFVSLLLGFFITNSVARWTSCVESFMGLFEAIRALQMQLHALGVAIEKIDRPVRYGLLSAWLLDKTLREERNKQLPERIWEQRLEGVRWKRHGFWRIFMGFAGFA